MGGFLALMLLALACAPSSKATQASSGFVLNMRAGADYQRDFFIYEAALSGVGPVETAEVSSEEDDAGVMRTTRTIRRWSSLQDAARCAELAEKTDWAHRNAEQILVLPLFVEHELVQGRCVVGAKVGQVSATKSIDGNVGRIELREGGRALLTASSLDSMDLLQALGIRQTYVRLWDANDERVPDKVTDEQLLAALKSTPRMQLAALSVLQRRYDTYSSPNGPLRIREIQSTGRVVGEALARSGLLSSPKRDVRASALRAAVGLSAAEDMLAPKIQEALDTKVDAIRESKAEDKFRERLGSIADGLGMGAEDGALPGYALRNIRDTAGLAAAGLGPKASQTYYRYMRPLVPAGDWATITNFETGVLAAFAKSGEADSFALQNLDTEGPPYRFIMFRMQVLGAQSLSPALANRVLKICTDTKTPRYALSEIDCDVIAYRRGEKMALRSVVAKLKVDAPFAASALLLDFGPEGVRALRNEALTADQASSRAILDELCYLGRDGAGPEVLAKARKMAKERPEDYNMQVIAGICEKPVRTGRGAFAPSL